MCNVHVTNSGRELLSFRHFGVYSVIAFRSGFEQLVTPNGYEECGPSTNWQWTYDVMQRPPPSCIRK